MDKLKPSGEIKGTIDNTGRKKEEEEEENKRKEREDHFKKTWLKGKNDLIQTTCFSHLPISRENDSFQQPMS